MNSARDVRKKWPRRQSTGWMLAGVLAAMCTAGGSPVAAQITPGQPPPAPIPPPQFDLKDPAAVAEGRRLYHSTCTFYCHGRDGAVGRAPKLRGRHLEPDYVYKRIANGFPPMPGYQRTLSLEQLWDLVAYVLSLGEAKDE